MKRIIVILFAVFAVLANYAQGDNRFNPEQYKKDLEAALIRDAKLTPSEAQAVIPIFFEMRDKERALYDKERNLYKKNPADNQEAEKILQEMNCIERDIQKIHNCYLARALKIVSATKVLAIKKSEAQFHRNMMRRMANKGKKR